MNPVLVLTRLYITESMRRQLHLITLFLAVMILVLPTLFNAFGMTGFDRVTKDVGLTLLGLYAVGMALFLGSTALPGISSAHLASLLARPISRMQHLLGKFLGYLVYGSEHGGVGPGLLTALAVLGTHADPAVLIPVSFTSWRPGSWGFLPFASTFCSPALAGVLGCFTSSVGFPDIHHLLPLLRRHRCRGPWSGPSASSCRTSMCCISATPSHGETIPGYSWQPSPTAWSDGPVPVAGGLELREADL